MLFSLCLTMNMFCENISLLFLFNVETNGIAFLFTVFLIFHLFLLVGG